ncbi:MAG: A/G-specific adenine glycosylase, partial [Thermoanaerobaculia bacterium]|nr:A/G-specific adenine glycosylase [Thermoanaerobaculia bacterium]
MDAPSTIPTERLLAWYESRRRSLPWRGRSDPYEIWVSEVMLQQTRSGTVERYYEPFLGRFPDLESLARADEEEILAAWSGLGYYRRARQLPAAARILAERDARLPGSVEELELLPGIGAYTAAAIASLAFGVAVPVVDGNVERVLSRYRSVDEPVRSAAGRRRLREIAEELMDRQRPGEFNQALMELGALVCLPRNPECGVCPLAEECLAHRAGSEESYPVTAPRRASRRERWLVVVARRGESVLLAHRSSDEALLAGLWELPWVGADVQRPARSLANRYGGLWRL